MIDLHCHILFGVDDGVEDLEESLELARAAVADGVDRIAATPHHRNGVYENEAEDVRERLAALQQELDEAGIPLKLLVGQEIRYYDALMEDLELRRGVATLNDSRYFLLEFPSGEVPAGIEEAMHEFRVMGLVPIIAHPERNRELAANPDKLAQLVRLGALAQVTSQSLVGFFGRSVQRTAIEMCRRRLVHVVASDAHGMKKRPFVMREAYGVVAKAVGPEEAERFALNAERVVDDVVIEYVEPLARAKKGRLRRLWRLLRFWRRRGE